MADYSEGSYVNIVMLNPLFAYNNKRVGVWRQWAENVSFASLPRKIATGAPHHGNKPDFSILLDFVVANAYRELLETPIIMLQVAKNTRKKWLRQFQYSSGEMWRPDCSGFCEQSSGDQDYVEAVAHKVRKVWKDLEEPRKKQDIAKKI
ncbi:6916_t:CDS:2 [Paraglomus brasilianum]|uniref:6916_t:CDS:1 n=1 Tax=Paraglomus brasilianum TaxID=144538 RepID=A0A9N9DJA7_9GLOM|nr:6916_t:CDS:2 [Paraglomus brasilianum]